ncbi:radical SAM protein [Mucilaginibacter terrenus]|uniref:Radical SAM protein n=1 Tax=Mucilaginibacter terrenus TaxID=2482727 RepID=A0A3E2NXH1_9SPHI|nr:radical SAM protein [Mucilaginibacter terrenus]RFZ85715.1 radical SAM protein [Mucilaginibacter terrenus]
MELLDILNDITTEARELNGEEKSFKLWMPKRVVFTADALEQAYGQKIYERIKELNLNIEIAKNNRITGLRGKDERETYRIAKNTLAIVNAPPSAFNLRPIPPSADWQFHLAEGCPAHCQYCYLAGSLSGPPAIRVFANLPQILENTIKFESLNQVTSFEASCYTDPLSLEHLTGGLAESINHFADRPNTHLRFVTKFDNVSGLLNLNHQGRTRFRSSLNADVIARKLEGGTPNVSVRIKALRKMALPRQQGGGGYPIGVVLAPIMPIPDWELHYSKLMDELELNLNFEIDLTFELITHRFTPGSRDILMEWYPNTSLDFSETNRAIKRNKFGGHKYVFVKELMKELKSFFEAEIARRFPNARILYWT